MSRRCTKCGSFLTENDRFCPGCGENAPVEVDNAPVHTAAASQQYGNYAPPPVQPAPAPYVPNNAPQYNPYQNQQEEMTVGKWLVTILVTSLGCIGFIFLFVWGFGDGPKARQNYCKAMLIFMGIGVALYILLYVFIFAIMGLSMSEIVNEYDYTTYAAVNLMNFLGR